MPCWTCGWTLATPDPPVSAEVPLTVTVPPTTLLLVGEVTAPVGAAVSIWRTKDFGVSALPGVSTEKKRTVEDVETTNGAVYKVEAVVGVVSLVV